MGKRSNRIQGQELQTKLPEWVGKSVHLVTMDNRTWFGKLLATDGKGATLRDANAAWYNRRRHTHLLPWAQIREAITDFVAEY